jgi:transcriptional regulator with XRE-family HTH domain
MADKKQPVVDFNIIRTCIRNARTEKRMTYKQLADKTGYSTGFLSAIETGCIDLDITILFRILNALDHDIVIRRRKQQHKLFQ